MKKLISNLLIVSIFASCSPAQFDNLKTAATAICDSLTLAEEHSDELDRIKSHIESKDYISALVESKMLYSDMVESGDTKNLPELMSLISVLNNLVSKVPLKALNRRTTL